MSMQAQEISDDVIRRGLIEAVDSVDRSGLGPLQRLRLARLEETLKTDRRPQRREMMIDRAMSAAIEKQAITQLPDGTLAAFDWSQLIKVFLELLPVLLKLFGL